ncbi:MAG: uL15 family ribosomal protein [Candidatus Diapherotrites archaeon]|nr:uL15 family ribosomal protein [Candidatus Diapherotrites archaeon]
MKTLPRRRKKNIKFRGERVQGCGNTASKRGKGRTGGRGRGGSHKHKFSKYYMTFGKKGFKRPGEELLKGINVYDIYEQVKAGKLGEKKDGKIVVDLTEKGYDILLGRGNPQKLDSSLEIKVGKVTAKAKEKSEALGWTIIGIGDGAEQGVEE